MLRSQRRVNFGAPLTRYILGRGRAPSPDDIDADQFHRYFDEKVAGVRSATADAAPPSFLSTSQASFCQFRSVTTDDVTAAVRALPDKSCVWILCRQHS